MSGGRHPIFRKDGSLATNPPITPETIPPASEPATPPARSPIAPAWHTIIFMVIVVTFSVFGAREHAKTMERHGRESTYLFTMAWEWILVLYIVWGIQKRGVKLRELIGGRWKAPEDFLIDVGIAVGFWIAALLVLALAAYAANLADVTKYETAKKTIDAIRPQGRVEIITWLCLASTAGFCEEVMFRGYLMKQFAAWTRVDLVAVILQTLFFGVAHGYQGPRLMFVITVYGMLFGVLAVLRRSLRPGMIAHALQDTLSGLAGNLPIK